MSHAASTSVAALLLGVSSAQWIGGALPQPLTAYGLPGCTLLTSLDVIAPSVTDAIGAASWLLPIPIYPGLVGIPFFAQVAVITAPATPFAAFTSGLQLIGQ